MSKQDLGIEWGGYFDFYNQLSSQAHTPSPVTPAGPSVLEGRFFDRHSNQLTLNMAEFSVRKKTGKLSFRTDFAFGEMVDQLSGGGSQSLTGTGVGQNPTNSAANEPTRNITQAILTYAVNEQLTINVGKFYTHMGLEVTKAKDNWQYSRSYAFNYGTFWHEGLSGTFAVVPGKFSTTIYLVNAWDGRISQEQNKSSTVGANFNFTGIEDLVLNYNYVGGEEMNNVSRREVHELNLTYSLKPDLTFAADFNLGSQNKVPSIGNVKWNSMALYLRAQINEKYIISPRFEIFDDSDKGFVLAGAFSNVGAKQKISSWTLANNFTLDDGLEARIELRSDKSSSNLFFKDKEGRNTDSQDSLTAALLYAF